MMGKLAWTLYIITMLLVFISICIIYYQHEKICDKLGNNYYISDHQANVEPGYLICCKSLYEKHILIKEECKAVKK